MVFCCVCNKVMSANREKRYCEDCEKIEKRRKYLVAKSKRVTQLSALEDRELCDIIESYKRYTAMGKSIPWQWK